MFTLTFKISLGLI